MPHWCVLAGRGGLALGAWWSTGPPRRRWTRRISEWWRARSSGTGAREGVAIVPGHPLVGMKDDFTGVLEQLGEVVEGVDTFELAGVDEGHEQVADAGAVERFEEQRGFAMQDGLLQASFANVIVQGHACDPQEQRQLVPVVGHVGDGLPEAGVGFDELVIDLCVHPRMQVVHQRAAVGLVEHEALLGGEFSFFQLELNSLFDLLHKLHRRDYRLNLHILYANLHVHQYVIWLGYYNIH